MSSSQSQKNIVVIGGGIIGCTTAYYLTHHPSYSPETTSVIILEASSVAGGASGKAGGLIAKWAYPQEIVDITFSEHEKLAQAHDGATRWGWRYCEVGQWEGRGEPSGDKTMPASISLNKKDGLSGAKKSKKSLLPMELDWVKEELTESYAPMAGTGDTAQVHPYLFTTSMCELAREKGAKLILGRATRISYEDVSGKGKATRKVTSVTYTDADTGESETLPATHVIVSAGPWTSELLPKVPISGTRAHSITVRPSRPVSAYVLFTEIEMPGSRIAATPEIYARPNNEVYACSPGDGKVLPASTALVEVDNRICDALFEQVSAISTELRSGEVTARQACYLPNVNTGPRGCPIVGEDEETKGLLIAAGHTCWVRLKP